MINLDAQGEGAQVELKTGAKIWVPCVQGAMAPAGPNLIGHRVRVDDDLGYVVAYEDALYSVELEASGEIIRTANVVSAPGFVSFYGSLIHGFCLFKKFNSLPNNNNTSIATGSLSIRPTAEA